MATFLDKCSLYWDFTTQAGSTGKLHPIKPVVKDLNGDFASVVRASPKTIVDKNGLQTIGNNEPPLSQVNGKWGLFPESGRTNLLQRTEEFNNPYWAKSGAGSGTAPAVTPNNKTAPNGTTTADTIIFDKGAGTTSGDNSVLQREAVAVTNGIPYVGSFYIKASTPGDVGKVLGFRHVGAVLIPVTLTSDWQRVEYVQNSNSTSINYQITLRGDIHTNNQVSVDIWGAQLEAGSFASSYIKNVNTSAGVPRSADVITLTNAQDFIGQEKGFIYAEVDLRLLGATSNNFRANIVSLNDGSATNRVEIAKVRGSVTPDDVRFRISFNNNNVLDENVGGSQVGLKKYMFVYNSGNVRGFSNGTKFFDSNITFNFTNILNTIFFGHGADVQSIESPFYRIGIGKETLTDEEAIALTS